MSKERNPLKLEDMYERIRKKNQINDVSPQTGVSEEQKRKSYRPFLLEIVCTNEIIQEFLSQMK